MKRTVCNPRRQWRRLECTLGRRMVTKTLSTCGERHRWGELEEWRPRRLRLNALRLHEAGHDSLWIVCRPAGWQLHIGFRGLSPHQLPRNSFAGTFTCVLSTVPNSSGSSNLPTLNSTPFRSPVDLQVLRLVTEEKR